MAQQNNDPINSLPEYEVRTMQDDLNKIEGKTVEPKLVNLKVPEIQVPKPIIKKEEKIPEPPKELPIIEEAKETLKTPLSEEIDNILNASKLKSETKPEIKIPETKKSSLPDIEDFIVPVPPPAPTPTATPIPPPIKPITKKTIKPITQESNEIETTIKAHKTKKILIILGIIVIIVIVINLIGYLIISKIKKQEPNPLPIDNQPEISMSLIRVDETKIFKIENNSSLIDMLINEENSGQPEKTLKRIVPTKISGNALSLNELTQELRIYIPPYTLAELKNNYTLVTYKQGEQQRIGLIVEINNLEGFIEKSKSWEKTMPWNFQGIFLNHQPNNLTTNGFSDNKYNETNIRIVDLSVPELSLDYAIKNNLFLMSTSRESIYNIIDRLK
ncbi:MAG: hypothetical protein V1686_01730 [Patescibacteria group bacterium]